MSEEIREPDLELLTRYRRDLHRIPELDFDLDETLAYVLDQLRPLEADPRVRVFSPCRSTLCCLFDRDTDEDGNPLIIHSGTDEVILIIFYNYTDAAIRVVPFEDIQNTTIFPYARFLSAGL